jgi:hypothetical protein
MSSVRRADDMKLYSEAKPADGSTKMDNPGGAAWLGGAVEGLVVGVPSMVDVVAGLVDAVLAADDDVVTEWLGPSFGAAVVHPATKSDSPTTATAVANPRVYAVRRDLTIAA